MIRIAVLLLIPMITGCAYRFGLAERSLPGGYTQVAIPVFKNKTPEVGIEPVFTNALIRRFNRSQVARVGEKESAPVLLEGVITKIETKTQSAILSEKGKNLLPEDTVLTTNYILTVSAEITIRRKSDDRVIWQGSFNGERSYAAPILGTPVVNSANATYNQSARMEYISRVAEEMMSEAHDRITENF